MPLFGPAHVTVLVLFVVVLVPAWLVGRSRRSTGPGDPVTRGLGALVLLVGVGATAYDALTLYDLEFSLPLQLSDMAWIAAGAALWTRSRLLTSLAFFWSVLTLQAIVTPSLASEFPEFRFLAFWAIHLLTIWAVAVLVPGLRITPTWRDYRLTIGVTVVWAALVSAFNALAGTNYGYLARKPGSGSALDLFGPWPLYILTTLAVLCAIWALMTAPWARDPLTRVPAPEPHAPSPPT